MYDGSLSWTYRASFPTDPRLDGITLLGVLGSFLLLVLQSNILQECCSTYHVDVTDLYILRFFRLTTSVSLHDSFWVLKSINTRSDISQPLNHPAASLKNSEAVLQTHWYSKEAREGNLLPRIFMGRWGFVTACGTYKADLRWVSMLPLGMWDILKVH